MKSVSIVAGVAMAILLADCVAPDPRNKPPPTKEQIEQKPDASTPTPTPQEPVSRPLDPTGHPQ